MKKTVLITGCCGFIGSNMSKFLSRKGHNIIGIDNFLTSSNQNINYILNNKKIKFIEHDVCYPIKINEKIDQIIHFASTASPKDYLNNPIKTLQIGSIGTENILKLGKTNNATVLVASTSEICGILEHPQKESYFGNVNAN